RRGGAAVRPEPPAVPPPAPASPPAPKPEAVPAPPASPVKAEAAVTAVLERYTNALEQRDLVALKAGWPSLGGAQQRAIESDFNNARSISVQFVNPKIDVSGSTATITGVRRYGMQTRDGQRLRNEANTTLVLRQAGNGWHIESVRFHARCRHRPRAVGRSRGPTPPSVPVAPPPGAAGRCPGSGDDHHSIAGVPRPVRAERPG